MGSLPFLVGNVLKRKNEPVYLSTPTGWNIIARRESPGKKMTPYQSSIPLGCRYYGMWFAPIPAVAPWAMMLDAVGVPLLFSNNYGCKKT